MRFPMPTATRVAVKTILLATDFSAASDAAMNFAVGLACYYDSKLITAHVVWPMQYFSPEPAVSFIEQMDAVVGENMQQWAQRVRESGIPHTEVVPTGNVADCLSQLMSTSDQIDLLVMGTHGRMGLDKLINGSVAEEMIRQAKCPVLVVGPQVVMGKWGREGRATTNLEFEVAWKRILFATDLASGSLATAHNAVKVAEDHDAELTLLHVVQPSSESSQLPEIILGQSYKSIKLRNLLPPQYELKHAPEVLLEQGDPAEVITRVARRRTADLIVMGAHRTEHHLFAATHLWSSVVHHVIARADCPVLLLPR